MTPDPATINAAWQELRAFGLLWWINRSLHLFGWTIVVELDDNNQVERVYPTRCDYRGFTEEAEERGFRNVTAYMNANAADLFRQVEDET